MARKTEPAATLTSAATWHKMNEVITRNNQREMALVKRAQGARIDPLDILENKLEAFFRTILGESRYLEYVATYQEARSALLDRAESVIVQQEIQAGVADFNLVGAGEGPLDPAA